MLHKACQLPVSLFPGSTEKLRVGRTYAHTLSHMNLGKTLTDLATAPVRVGLAAADAGLGIANDALGMVQRALGEANGAAKSGSGSFAHMLGLDDAVWPG
jgi:hypothetical protein